MFDNLEAFEDLLFIGASAIAPKQELNHISRHGVLGLEFTHQVFTDDVTLECSSCNLV